MAFAKGCKAKQAIGRVASGQGGVEGCRDTRGGSGVVY